METHYDAIIIGGGHNGLVAAACLAKAGQQVLVLEKRGVLGGAAATESVFPGFKVNTGATDVGLFPETIIQSLFLKMHGLEFRQSPVAVFAPQPDGRALTLWHDEAQCVADIGRFSAQDARRFPDFKREVDRMTALLQQMLFLTPPDVMTPQVNDVMAWGRVGLQLKRGGGRQMMTFLRVLPMGVKAYLDEWFESDALKGLLGATGITGMHQGPRAAGTTMMMLYHHSNGFFRQRLVVGGTGQLSAALASVARHHGAVIETGAEVCHILLEDKGGAHPVTAVGVVLGSGERIQARTILSSADPRRTFFNLVGPQQLEPHFMRQVRRILYRGCTAKVNLALSGLPTFRGQTDEAQLSGRIRISPSLDYLEKAYDAAKYGRISERPYLDMMIPTLLDGTLAPAGQHLLTITMQYAPYHLRQDDWQTARERLGDLVVETLAAYAPDLPSLILQRQVLTPLDWEQEYGLTEGSIYQGQMSLDQMLIMRPVPGYSRYRTPIDNLYLCGAGTHPGGGVTGIPGYNAAREVLNAED